jgi:hypothetical protein
MQDPRITAIQDSAAAYFSKSFDLSEVEQEEILQLLDGFPEFITPNFYEFFPFLSTGQQQILKTLARSTVFHENGTGRSCLRFLCDRSEFTLKSRAYLMSSRCVLRHLIVSNGSLMLKDFVEILQKKNCTLTGLELPQCYLNHKRDPIVDLVRSLPSATNLMYFSLAHNKLGYKAIIEPLMEALKNSPSITHLNLRSFSWFLFLVSSGPLLFLRLILLILLAVRFSLRLSSCSQENAPWKNLTFRQSTKA